MLSHHDHDPQLTIHNSLQHANLDVMTASYPLHQYLSAQTTSGPSFSPDGSQVAFLADITGVPQVWRIPADGGWPEQLTFSSERVMRAQYAHHRPEIVFGLDSGGNEREQLYLWRDGLISDLAVDPKAIHTFGAISPNDDWIAYSDNSRDPAWFDVYVVGMDGNNRRCVYQQDGSNFVTDWSPDGRYLLIRRQTGALDTDLYLLDLTTQKAAYLTPHDPPVSYNQAVFSPDGQSIYLLTDQGSEFNRLARMDLEGHGLEMLNPDDADTDWLALCRETGGLALVRNHDGYGSLSIGSIENPSVGQPVDDLPRGVVLQPSWSADGSTLAFVFTDPSLNPNIWLWDQGSGARRLTFVPAGGVPADTFVSPELIEYESFDGRQIPGFLFMPANVSNPPVVFHVHGGPEGQALPAFSPVDQYLLSRGFAVFVPNVRGSSGYGRTYTHLDDVEKRMDSVADLKAAAGWFRASARVDANRLAVMGGSYGGFMVLAAITSYPDLWRAAVDIVGIANLETFLQNTSPYRRHWRIPEYGDPEKDRELLREISPIHRVDRIECPLLVIHGDNDPRVPLNEAEQIVSAVASRLPVEFLHFPDEGHGVVKLKNKLVAYQLVADFLEKFL
ncbi:MAG: S9 family peptidase [Chloroflexota bacterium]